MLLLALPAAGIDLNRPDGKLQPSRRLKLSGKALHSEARNPSKMSLVVLSHKNSEPECERGGRHLQVVLRNRYPLLAEFDVDLGVMLSSHIPEQFEGG